MSGTIYAVELIQTISTHARVAASGQVQIDVQTQLPAGEVDVVLVLVPRIPSSLPSKTATFADLAGRLSWRGDAVAEQRRQRDEW